MTIKAVAFDLLTALIDSWALWIDVAGGDDAGRAWRNASLRIVTAAGAYRPYEEIVAEAAAETGLPIGSAERLLARWPELRPWPEAPAVLAEIRKLGVPMAIVTNCSQRLAEIAAATTSASFDLVISAERAGVYKIDPRAYATALDGLRLNGPEVLFVAGSAHDVPGAGALGMPVYWSNRLGLPVPSGAPLPIENAPNLLRLPAVVAGRR